MSFDITTVLAGAVAIASTFGLFRLYKMWRSWSNSSKINDEIEMDKKISDAIKQGDVELIAKLRKFFLTYRQRKNADKIELPIG